MAKVTDNKSIGGGSSNKDDWPSMAIAGGKDIRPPAIDKEKSI